MYSNVYGGIRDKILVKAQQKNRQFALAGFFKIPGDYLLSRQR
jgi:hypothetical protein